MRRVNMLLGISHIRAVLLNKNPFTMTGVG